MCKLKKLYKNFNNTFIGLLVITVLFAFVFVSCSPWPVDVDEINNELDSILKRLPANSVDNPHIIVLNVSNLTGIRGALNANRDKYVHLDFSGSTFTSIPV